MSIATHLYTRLYGEFVGKDDFGNRYFQERKAPQGRRRKRWALYAGAAEPSTIPAEWHAWLHYTTAEPLRRDQQEKPWQREHVRNLTGTNAAYLPPGHDLRGGHRARSAADYESWTP